MFNLVFANNIILLYLFLLFFNFFLIFLIIDLYFLTAAVIMEIFIVIEELAMPTGIPIKETRAEMETHQFNA